MAERARGGLAWVGLLLVVATVVGTADALLQIAGGERLALTVTRTVLAMVVFYWLGQRLRL